jgi:hypothetical protein
MTINPNAMLDYVDDVIAATTDVNKGELLQVLRAHMAAEIAEDVEGLLATISPKQVQYRTWGMSPEHSPGTLDAVADFYANVNGSASCTFSTTSTGSPSRMTSSSLTE